MGNPSSARFEPGFDWMKSIKDGIHGRGREKLLDTTMDLFSTIPSTITLLREELIIILSILSFLLADSMERAFQQFQQMQ
jgi:hypothetical protein